MMIIVCQIPQPLRRKGLGCGPIITADNFEIFQDLMGGLLLERQPQVQGYLLRTLQAD
jgi:hypothetical protein